MYKQTHFPSQPPFEKFLNPLLNYKRQKWSPSLAMITTQTNDDGNFFWWEIIGKIQTFLVCHNYYTRDRIGLTSWEDGKHIDISGKDNKPILRSYKLYTGTLYSPPLYFGPHRRWAYFKRAGEIFFLLIKSRL